MTGRPVVRPFRWDVARREQLGSYARREAPATYRWFRGDLLECSARVLALAGDSDLVFVGRSPDALFHFLSGILAGTQWADRLDRFSVSVRWNSFTLEQRKALEPYLAELGLYGDPLLRRPRPAALVDVVDTGRTLAEICRMLRDLTVREGVEWRAAARKLRIVALTWREAPSPSTWRWQQQPLWSKVLPKRALKSVSVPGDLFAYLASEQPKMSDAYTPRAWGDPAVGRPLRDRESRDAVALALDLYELGQSQRIRDQLARELARQPAMREAWFRTLVQDVKRRPRRGSDIT